MLQQSAHPRGFRVGEASSRLIPSLPARGLIRRLACAALLLLVGLLAAAPAVAQNATVVSITGSKPATFARVGQVLTFNVQLYTGNTDIDSLTFTSGSPSGMSGLSCPGVPAALLTTTNCTFTYTIQPMDMAIGTISALGRWTATRPTGATRSGTTNTLVVSFAPPREPDAPVIGTATAGNTQATVAFTPPDFDGGWPVDGYTVTSSPGGITASGGASPITVTGLTNGVAYNFTVTATNVMGTGAASAPSNSVTPAGPQTITFANPGAQNFGTSPALTATASSGLAVSFSSDTPAVCTTTNGGVVTFVATGSCTMTANQAGDAAFNAAAPVSQSFTVNAVAPGAPTIGTATAGDAEATITFTAPGSTGGAAITGYTVTAGPGGMTVSGTASPITVTGLTNGTAYTFTVTATNGVATSAASGPSNAATPRGGQTITFNNPGAQNFGTSPTLTATSTSGLPVTFSSSTSGVCTITSGGTLTFVTVGTCTIDADQAGDTATTAAATSTRSFTVNAVVPGAPTAVTATAGDTQAAVAFTAPAYTGGAAITGYTVTSSPGGLTASGAASPIVVSGLSNGTAYTFTVTATNAAGTGSASTPSAPVTPTGSQTITFNSPSAQNFGTSPTLTATSDSGLPVTFTSATAAVCTITPGGTLTFAAAGSCTINADQAGDAGYLPAAQVSRTFAVYPVLPGAPTAVTATAGDTQAAVAFTAPAYTGGAAITGYTVTSSPGGLTASGAESPIIVSGLTNGVAYTFTVTATNPAGTGSPSPASAPVTPIGGQTISFTNPGAQNFGTSPTLVATSDSGLPVTFSSSTTGVCTITSGGTLTFATVGTCTINADQAGDASRAAALQVSQSFAVNPVVPGAPTVGSASIAGPGEVTVTFTAPAFTGGAAVTGYTVTSSPGGVTATGAGSPISVTGLTPGTTYTFTVTATNAAGTGAASAATNPVTPVPALTAGPVNLAVAYGAGATAVDLDITGTPSSVAIATAPAHGTAVASGTTVTYQPASGYAGTDSFTYTASDAYTTTAPATVTVTVAAPSVALDPAAPPTATGGSAYAHSFSATGGAAPYAFGVIAGTLPAGLTLSSAGQLSGIPTQAGSFGFTVQATDSSTGTGPFTDQRAYTLVVEAPAIAFAMADWPDATYGNAFDHALQASGGTAPYAFEVIGGALPQGVDLSAAGILSGVPQEAGRFEVTVRVRDANGFTAQQVFELVVLQAAQAITGFSTNPTQPVFAPDGTFLVTAQGGVSGNPLVFASTTPAVCTVDGTTVSMRGAGRCSLTADQTGGANFEAAAQARLDVDIAAAVPTLAWPEQLSKVLGEPAFALDNPASPSAGAFTFTSSQAEVARIEGRIVTLVGAGTTVITATQAAAGNYAGATVQMRLSVTGRPDPTGDPDVTGLLQAQVDASVRFANAQQSNIRDRLRQVRNGANTSTSNLTLAYADGGNRPGQSVPLGQAAAGLWPSMPRGWGAWLAGTATVGSGRGTGYDFDTDGITLGADRVVGDNLLVGIAGSLAHNDSQLEANGVSRMQANQRSLALYGLWRTGEHLFVDAVAGTGRLDFDLQRWSNEAGALGTGTRKGDQWFASVALGYEHRGPVATLTGYGRLDTSHTRLDAYLEHGLGLYDLAYRRQDVDNSTVALGLEGSYLLGDAGRIRPFWTVEYRQALDDKGDAAMNYVVLPQAADYRFAIRSYNDQALAVSAGLDVRMGRSWLVSLLLGHEQARLSSQGSSIGLRLSYDGQAASTRSGSGDATAGQAPAAGCSSSCDGAGEAD